MVDEVSSAGVTGADREEEWERVAREGRARLTTYCVCKSM